MHEVIISYIVIEYVSFGAASCAQSLCLLDARLTASSRFPLYVIPHAEVVLFYLILLLILQIPELDFEIPPEAQRGSLSTVWF